MIAPFAGHGDLSTALSAILQNLRLQLRPHRRSPGAFNCISCSAIFSYQISKVFFRQGDANSVHYRLEYPLEDFGVDELCAGELRVGEFGRILGFIAGRQTIVPEVSRQIKFLRQPICRPDMGIGQDMRHETDMRPQTWRETVRHETDLRQQLKLRLLLVLKTAKMAYTLILAQLVIMSTTGLLHKLQNSFGYRVKCLLWFFFCSYLTHRRQRVEIEGTTSEWWSVVSGLCGAQVSIIGPSLFLAFINDIPQLLNSSWLLYDGDLKYSEPSQMYVIASCSQTTWVGYISCPILGVSLSTRRNAFMVFLVQCFIRKWTISFIVIFATAWCHGEQNQLPPRPQSV